MRLRAGMKMALEERAHLSLGPAAETRLVDICAEGYPRFTSVLRKCYLKAIHHAPNIWVTAYNGLDTNAFFMRHVHRLSALREVMKEEIETFKPDPNRQHFSFLQSNHR